MKPKRSKTRVLEQEFKSAKAFLENDPQGRRLQAAEHALVLLIKDELPRLKRFVFNAEFDLRRMKNKKLFNLGRHPHPANAELFKQSGTAAFAKPTFTNDGIQFALFYDSELSDGEAALYSSAFGNIIAATYAALGLDMSGLRRAESVALSNLIGPIEK